MCIPAKAAEPKKGTRSHRAIALTSVMSKRCATFDILRLEKEKGPKVGSSCTWVVLMASGVTSKTMTLLEKQ